MHKVFNTTIVGTVLLFSIFSCKPDRSKYPDWEVVYKSSKEGKVLSGSKTELINAIRKGTPVRIGWGSKGASHSIEHLSEPIWLAILDEEEVIAHLDPQVLSSADWDNLSANYADSTKLIEEWRVVLTTKGEFDAVWYDRKENKQIKRIPQNHVMTWFVKTNSISDTDAKPFFEE